MNGDARDCSSAKTVSGALQHDRGVKNACDTHEEAAMVPQAYRLRAIMKQGTAASIPQTWTHYRIRRRRSSRCKAHVSQ